MTQASAITEALGWLSGMGDPIFLDLSYEEVVRDLSRATGVFQQWTVFQGQAGVQTYTLPASTIGIDTIVWTPTELLKTTAEALDLVKPERSADQGVPLFWMEDQHSQNTVEVYPTPTVTGAVPPQATNNPVAFYRWVPPEADIPSWLEGIIAMRLAAREAARLGETQDAPLATTLEQVSAAILADILTGGPA
jgi:hypothetical protein